MAGSVIVVKTIGDARSLVASTKESEAALERQNKAFKKAKAVAAASVAVGVFEVLTQGWKEYASDAKAMAQTNAVIKSTGGVANVSAKHVKKLGDTLESLTGINNGVIQTTENVLLTFTNIRNEAGKGNDIFDQSTVAVTDMSVALGIDGKDAAIQFGKALNDPIKGITALRREGVSFTKAQEDAIKADVKRGDTLSAQKIILQEVQKEFGGSAVAAGKTLPGQLNKAKQAFINVSEVIVTKLLPPVLKLLDFFNRHKVIMGILVGVIGTVVTALTALFIIEKVGKAVEFFTMVAKALNATLDANPIILVILGIVALGAALYLAYKKVKVFHDIVDRAWQMLQSGFKWVKHNWPLLVAILVGPIGIAGLLIFKHFDAIKSAAKTAFNAVVGFVKALPGRLLGYLSNLGGAGVKLGAAILNGLVNGLGGAIGKVADIGKAIANTAIKFMNIVIGDFRSGIRALANALANVNIPGIGRAFDAASSLLNNVASGIPSIPHFDQGGLVQGALGQPVLAVVHGGERVLTPGQQQMGGGHVIINMPAGIDPEAVVRAQRRYNRLNGISA